MKNINYILRLISVTTAVCSLVSLTSCMKDEIDGDILMKGIGYEVSFDNMPSSDEIKSMGEGGRVVKTFELKSQDGSLVIPVAMIENEGMPSTGTKGRLIGENGPIALSDSIDVFTVHAFNTDSNADIFATGDSTARYTDGLWSMLKTYYWPQSTSLDFYAYANLPKKDKAAFVELENTNHRQLLTYTVPSNTDDQKDILMALYSGTGSFNGKADIRFCHPLTAVQFSRAESPEMTGITNITMSGVHYKGQATQTMEDPTDFSWKLLENKTSTVIQDRDGAPFEVHGRIDGDPFLLIPQKLTEGNYVDLSVTVVYNEHQIPINARISMVEWEAGKTYTYEIGYSGTLEVEFTTDKLESETVRKNAVVKNTGTKKCYVRTTAVGYINDIDNYIKSTWLNDSGQNKGTFTVSDGTFSTPGGWNGHWFAGTDGFWYYKKPLECTGSDEVKQTTPLFNQYSITTLGSGEHFEMVLSAQAVEWDSEKAYVAACWGESIADLLDK